MSKNADRARIEKDLEDMMGNDWRLFRAKLVAQERVEALEGAQGSCGESEEKKLQQFVSGAISTLFGRAENSSELPKEHSRVIKERENSKSDVKLVYIGGSSVPVEDPFATEDELPVMMQPKVNLDRHRWAHPIGHIEPGCILIANEKLGGVFHQTIVLIIDHHERTGSTGIVINRPLPGNLLKIASETLSNVDLSIKLAFNNAAVSYGGPVMQDEYTCLHGFGEVEGAKKVCSGVFVGGSKELLNEVRKDKFDPQQCLFVKGHAAWVPQQLQREISKGVWYTAAASDDFLLRYAGAPRHSVAGKENTSDDLWADIMTAMGGNYAEIAKRYQGRGDKRVMP
jgi:putative AlgH/UPF0301 family transcriptional regulator